MQVGGAYLFNQRLRCRRVLHIPSQDTPACVILRKVSWHVPSETTAGGETKLVWEANPTIPVPSLRPLFGGHEVRCPQGGLSPASIGKPSKDALNQQCYPVPKHFIMIATRSIPTHVTGCRSPSHRRQDFDSGFGRPAGSVPLFRRPDHPCWEGAVQRRNPRIQSGPAALSGRRHR